MKYYKVVRKNDLRSFGADCNTNAVQYKLNEFVYPTKSGTYLMVFDDLERARYFIRGGVTWDVYECECESVCKNTPLVHANQSWPDGTVFAYGVKLVKKINDIEFIPDRKWYCVSLDDKVFRLVIYTEDVGGIVTPSHSKYMVGKVCGQNSLDFEGLTFTVGEWKNKEYFTLNHAEATQLVDALNLANQHFRLEPK